MVCLIKSKYKEELDLYTQLLGSEKRAYAILCCNNGYTLDKTKDGKPSKLYNDLLEYYKGDVTKAVQKKAQLFTSEFTKDYGQWYQDGYEISDEYKDVFDENGEPLLHNTYFGTADNKILLDEQKEFASIEEEEQYILEHATRDENGKLLAPNGKPSNLTEKQWVQVRTKAFKEWFGDWENDPKNASKIVDENGEPLVVYRGDAAGKNTFEAKPASYNVTGIYFAGITEVVQSYVEPSYYNDYKEGEMYQVFINARNPFIGENRDIDDWNNGKLDEYDAWIYGRFPKGNGELVVRNSEQIKSATDNIGTFSKTNKDIRYNRNNDPVSSPQIDLELESKLSELRSRYRYIIEQKNTLSKQLHEDKIFKGVIHTDDGNITIQTEHGDDVNILWISSGDRILIILASLPNLILKTVFQTVVLYYLLKTY